MSYLPFPFPYTTVLESMNTLKQDFWLNLSQMLINHKWKTSFEMWIN